MMTGCLAQQYARWRLKKLSLNSKIVTSTKLNTAPLVYQPLSNKRGGPDFFKQNYLE